MQKVFWRCLSPARWSEDYGAPDGFGGTEKGLLIGTRPGAVVSLPSDGWVAFSAPYRSYGQLLIVNVGGGYYVVLAGMERINVEVGQFVLAGEPVAAMGDGSARTAAAIAIGAAQPILYVEFRKDGAAIDPGPWWAKPECAKGSRIMRKISLLMLGAVLGSFDRFGRHADAAFFKQALPKPPRPTPTAASICSATCSRRSAPTMSKSRTTES